MVEAITPHQWPPLSWAGQFWFWSKPFFPQQPLPTTRRSPFPSHVHSPVFFSPVSYACLATLRVDFLRNGDFRSLTRSMYVAEVTRGYRVSPTPLFMLRIIPDHDPLHEVSGVKVPRPANPFITHETIVVTSGDGGCCISWQLYGWVGWYSDLVWYIVMQLSWPYYNYSLDKLLEDLVSFWCLTSKAVN